MNERPPDQQSEKSTAPAEHAGDRMKRWRQAAGLTQNELAFRTGRGPSTISRAELAGVVTRDLASRVAGVVGCQPEDILGSGAAAARSSSATEPPDEFVTLREAAELLGEGELDVRRMIGQGRLAIAQNRRGLGPLLRRGDVEALRPARSNGGARRRKAARS